MAGARQLVGRHLSVSGPGDESPAVRRAGFSASSDIAVAVWSFPEVAGACTDYGCSFFHMVDLLGGQFRRVLGSSAGSTSQVPVVVRPLE